MPQVVRSYLPVAGIEAAPVAHRNLVLPAGGGERSEPPHGHAKPGAAKTGKAESPAATQIKSK